MAIYAAEKAIQLGGVVTTLSDSSGYIYDKSGLNPQKLSYLKQLKQKERGRISEYCKEFEAEFHPEARPWHHPCDVALPCATQNEISGTDAKALAGNGCRFVVEGANMPSSDEAITSFRQTGIVFVPGKAANAGGVALSGLEMSQNSSRLSWSEADLNLRLRSVMDGIHEKCVRYGRDGEHINYSTGANIAGFIKVAEALLAHGII